MRVGSLFTGYGGLDMAIGGDLVWYSEIDKAACQVLATHHPAVPNLGDIKEIDWSTVEPVDILTGGYPCQPFSHAGNRKGKNDERHLWPYVLDAIRAIRPQYAILENVSGHITLGFADVLADIAEIGWSCEWGTYRASDVGAPHRRERLFIVAINPDNNGASATERGRGLRQSQVTRGKQQHEGIEWELAGRSDPLVANAIDIGLLRANVGLRPRLEVSTTKRHWGVTSNADGERSQGHDSGSGEASAAGHGQNQQGVGALTTDTESNEQRESTELKGLRAELGNGVNAGAVRLERGGSLTTDRRTSTNGDTDGSDVGTLEKVQAIGGESGGVCGVDAGQHVADTDNGHGQTVGGVSGLRRRHAPRPDMLELSTVDWGKYAPGIRRWEVVLDRPSPAPTVQRKDKRRLNPQFVEWMMGLPDGWVTGHGLSAAQELKMLGNGVVPQQARAAITQLMERTLEGGSHE